MAPRYYLPHIPALDVIRYLVCELTKGRYTSRHEMAQHANELPNA